MAWAYYLQLPCTVFPSILTSLLSMTSLPCVGGIPHILACRPMYYLCVVIVYASFIIIKGKLECLFRLSWTSFDFSLPVTNLPLINFINFFVMLGGKGLKIYSIFRNANSNVCINIHMKYENAFADNWWRKIKGAIQIIKSYQIT